ncbi:hypothetical protein DL96DRAFT_1688680 [Flagelloscypha sp. PMI_526]|nr:hypothetical protein DL96DRAFT_1688680 [Flagelloscypha sp. PMI_526]
MGKLNPYRARRHTLITTASAASCVQFAQCQDADELTWRINNRLQITPLDIFLSPRESVDIANVYHTVRDSKDPASDLGDINIIATSRNNQAQIDLAVKNHAVELQMVKCVLTYAIRDAEERRRQLEPLASKTRAIHEEWRAQLILKYDADVIEVIRALGKDSYSVRTIYPQIIEGLQWIRNTRPRLLRSCPDILRVLKTQFLPRPGSKNKVKFGKGGEDDAIQPIQNAC